MQENQGLGNCLKAAVHAGCAPTPLQPPPAVVQFAKALALTNVDVLLNYMTKQGTAIFDKECATLPTKYICDKQC